MKHKKDKMKIQHKVHDKKKTTRFKKIPYDIIVYILKNLMTPDDKMSLVLTSKRMMTTFFDRTGIMKNIKTTFTKNDKTRRNFIRNYGDKLRNVSVNIDRGVYKFLKNLLPQISNVERLTVNLSEADAKTWSEIQPVTRSISLPNLRLLEVTKPVDLKIILSLAKNSITKVKYITEECDLRSIAEYLSNVQEFECDFPKAVPPFNTSLPVLSLDSITTVKFSTVHCGSVRDLRLPNIKSIEINKLARSDYYFRNFFNSIQTVENVIINSVMERNDIPDIIGEIIRLPLLKSFHLTHVGIFSIYINVEEQKIEVSDHIRENWNNIMQSLRSGFEWYGGE